MCDRLDVLLNDDPRTDHGDQRGQQRERRPTSPPHHLKGHHRQYRDQAAEENLSPPGDEEHDQAPADREDDPRVTEAVVPSEHEC